MKKENEKHFFSMNWLCWSNNWNYSCGYKNGRTLKYTDAVSCFFGLRWDIFIILGTYWCKISQRYIYVTHIITWTFLYVYMHVYRYSFVLHYTYNCNLLLQLFIMINNLTITIIIITMPWAVHVALFYFEMFEDLNFFCYSILNDRFNICLQL